MLLTRYAGEPVRYLGFFESADDAAVSAGLFAAAEQVAADAGATAVVGPVDASFWIRYRLKVSGFEHAPYFSEPLNPPDPQRLDELVHPAGADPAQVACRRRRRQGITDPIATGPDPGMVPMAAALLLAKSGPAEPHVGSPVRYT